MEDNILGGMSLERWQQLDARGRDSWVSSLNDRQVIISLAEALHDEMLPILDFMYALAPDETRTAAVLRDRADIEEAIRLLLLRAEALTPKEDEATNTGTDLPFTV